MDLYSYPGLHCLSESIHQVSHIGNFQFCMLFPSKFNEVVHIMLKGTFYHFTAQMFIVSHVSVGPRHEKTCLWEFANNTGAHQHVHPRSLISTFVIRFLESMVCKLPKGKISIF